MAKELISENMETQLNTQLLGFMGNKFNTALLEKDINLIATAEGYVEISVEP